MGSVREGAGVEMGLDRLDMDEDNPDGGVSLGLQIVSHHRHRNHQSGNDLPGPACLILELASLAGLSEGCCCDSRLYTILY